MRRAVLLCEKASVRRIFLLQYPAHFLRAFRAVPGDPELYHRLQPLAEKGLMVIKLLLRRKIKFPDQPLQVILHYGWQRLKGQALPAVAFQIAAEKILILTDKLKQLQKTARQTDLLIYDKKIQKLCIHFSHNTAHQSINIFKMAVKGGPVYPGQTADLAHRNLTDILLLQQLHHTAHRAVFVEGALLKPVVIVNSVPGQVVVKALDVLGQGVGHHACMDIWRLPQGVLYASSTCFAPTEA